MRKKRFFLTAVLAFALVTTAYPVVAAETETAAGAVTDSETETAPAVEEAEAAEVDTTASVTDDVTEIDSMEVAAGETLALNSKNFPDEYFLKYLKEEYDSDGNGYIDPATVTTISIRDMNTKSLKGVENFYNLEYLSTGMCIYVEELDVSKNTKLTSLNASMSNIKKIDVSKNTELTYLNLQASKISELDVSKNTKLETLWVNQNNLTELDVSNLKNLKTLACGGNNITKLDVSNNIYLEDLRCYANGLTKLDVSNNKNLTYLGCYYNEIEELDVTNCTKLVTLWCSTNKISKLDVSGMTEIKWLWCDNNSITELDVRNCTKVETLCCENNKITQLDISNCTNLREFVCDPYAAGNLKVSAETNVTVDYCSQNKEYSFEMEISDGRREIRCENLNTGEDVIDEFVTDGVYTYYFQYDGTAMTDRLTYHPDGHPQHIIYFDEYGHEVFSDFAHVKMSITGDAVDDYCFFNVYGYMYKDVLTYDKAGVNIYYANTYGVLERNGWFQFSDGGYGYANADATLMTSQHTYDWNGNLVYMEADGHIRGTGDGRNLWPK